MKMKKMIGLLLCITLLFCLAGSTFAQSVNYASTSEYKNVRITFNGERIIMVDDNQEIQKCIVRDGQIYVPIEYFIEAIGGTCAYDMGRNQAVIKLNQEAPVPEIADISGQWHEVSNKSIVLSLNTDGTFNLRIIASAYTGTWTFDGSTLTLTQRNSDLTGEYSNSILRLKIGGRYFSFVR